MKCLSCKTTGKHFERKICPTCTNKGVTREDIVAVKRDVMFFGNSANVDAGKYVTDLRAKKNVSNVKFKITESNVAGQIHDVKVSWVEYELKDSGGTHGTAQANKSK